MAIATLAAFKDALNTGIVPIIAANTSVTTVIGRTFDLMINAVPAFTAPTTPVVPTSATAGSFGQNNPATGQLSLIGSRVCGSSTGAVIVCDRLSHQAGLSGIVTTAQTTNLPTAALTRYTSGDGVMIGITIYTAIGATATTITASYTNQAGVAGKITQAMAFGGTGFNTASRLILLPLASGDTGVRSVESVTVLATTGTAGNFGVTLFKPLYFASIESLTLNNQPTGFLNGCSGGGIPSIVNDACLFHVGISTTTGLAVSHSAIFAEN